MQHTENKPLSKKAALIIMDGWGLGKDKKADAIQNAKTPFVDSLYLKYPHSKLITCGKDVGLPEGQMGNSEVGHINIGAGRIVFQELQRISNSIESGELENNPTLNELIDYCKQNNKPLHLMGLVSDGGVHSHQEHVVGLLKICKKKKLQKTCIHAFTDGRDTDPKSSLSYLKYIEENLDKDTQSISTIIGRYYAMDRDNRWERIQKAYECMVRGIGKKTDNYIQAIQQSYEDGITDEFIQPILIKNKEGVADIIQEGDAVLCFNYRTDRCRQIVKALTQEDFPTFNMEKLNIRLTTMTEYNKSFQNINVIFHNENLINTLGEVLACQGKTQLRIAETEKYPHVTFFFNGGREQKFEGEKRIMVSSPKVATYDMKPEMSAYEITEKACTYINDYAPDFMCLNFANTDMVGHTGVWKAAITAAETVDDCVKRVVEKCLEKNIAVFLTADHGNSDCLINDDGSPNTAHTLNPVPLFFISQDKNNYTLDSGKLADIAPSILTYMNISIPQEMTGNVLIRT